MMVQEDAEGRLINVMVSAADVSDAAALRELADWMDAQPSEMIVLGVTPVNEAGGGKRLALNYALLERFTSDEE